MFDFQLRHATQHDFATIIRFAQALLSELEMLSGRELTDRAEAWQAFERRTLQTLSGDENGAHTYPCATDHLLEIAETIGETSPSGTASSIGLIEAGVLQPTPIFRLVPTLYIHALYVLPPYRDQGVGTALLRAALVWGRQQHCQQARLSVLPHNPVRRLYQALGFTVAGLEMCQALTRTPPDQ